MPKLLHKALGVVSHPLGSKLGVFSSMYSQKIRSVFGSNLTAHWPLNDKSGIVANVLGPPANGNILYNAGFEVAGGGGADVFGNWGEAAGDGTIEDETVNVHKGSHALKLTTGTPSETTNVSQTISVSEGDEISVSFFTRGDGTHAGRWAIYDVTNTAWIRSLASTGVTGTTFTEITDSFTVPADCTQIRFYCYCAAGEGSVCYFDDVKLLKTQTLSGTYAASGITYGETGIGDGQTSISLDGNNTYVQVGYPKFNAAWNGNKGSVIAWGKVDGSGRWTDASTYRYLWHPKSTPDATVYMVMGKNQTNHQLEWRRRVAGSIFSQTYTFSPTGTLDWFCMGMTWDVTAGTPYLRGYLYTKEDRVWQKVFDAEPSVGTELWDNDQYPVDSGNNVLMAGSTAQQEWIGWGAHVAYGAGVVLSDAQMHRVMTL